jgi:hypothetical protein
MIYTIADIEKGMWVITVYDRDTPLQVTMVDYDNDQFEAIDRTGNELWEKLSSYDLVKVLKGKPELQTINYQP